MTLRLALRNLGRHRRRTILTVLVIGLGLGIMILSTGMTEGMNDAIVRVAVETSIGHVQVHKEGWLARKKLGDTIPDVAKVRAVIGESPSSARVVASGLCQAAEKVERVTVLGIDPEAEAAVTVLEDKIEEGTFVGDAPRPPAARPNFRPKPIVVGWKLAQRLEVRLGGKVRLQVVDATGMLTAEPFWIVGILRTGSGGQDASTVWVRKGDAQALYGLGDRVHEVAVRLGPGVDPAGVVARLRPALSGCEVNTWGEVEPAIQNIIDVNDGFMAWIYLIIVVLVASGIVNTTYMSIFERRRELGMMQAIGAKPAHLFNLVMAESALTTALGVVVGVVLGCGHTWWFAEYGLDLRTFMPSLDVSGFALDTHLFARLDVSVALPSTLFVAAGGVVASLIPAWSVAREAPLDALRST